jgi:hypothetical protein
MPEEFVNKTVVFDEDPRPSLSGAEVAEDVVDTGTHVGLISLLRKRGIQVADQDGATKHFTT